MILRCFLVYTEIYTELIFIKQNQLKANNLWKIWRWLPIKDIYDPKKRPALKSWKICDNNEQSLGDRLTSNDNLINTRPESEFVGCLFLYIFQIKSM